ncbi:subunit ChlI of Mg-chelatase family protein [Pseudomonas aeruginosa]|nr:subunit ChlI of Mg-chelatase family protein [Pseudomonas aeruginosa]
MSLAIVHSRAQVGVEAPCVSVEAHLANGLPSLTLVGLPETAVRESKDRVRSALLNAGFDFPARRITLNLAPADLPKDGGRFDLAIALGILAASGQLPGTTLDGLECLGELALSGAIRPVRGVLPAALAARDARRVLVVPKENAEEASLASGLTVFAVDHLLEIAGHLSGQAPLLPYQARGLLRAPFPYPDLAEVQGQAAAKRALLVAAAGAHNLLLSGPPGTGKTLLASRLPGLLPALDEDEALEVAAIHSVASHVPLRHWPQRPFRQPHHSASAPALVGGGSRARSPWRTRACFSSTNCRSSSARSWRSCASRWKAARSSLPGPTAGYVSRRASNWWRLLWEKLLIRDLEANASFPLACSRLRKDRSVALLSKYFGPVTSDQ